MANQNSEETGIQAILLVAALFSIFIIFLIMAFIIIEGWPAFADYGFFKFLFGLKWDPSKNVFGVYQ